MISQLSGKYYFGAMYVHSGYGRPATDGSPPNPRTSGIPFTLARHRHRLFRLDTKSRQLCASHQIDTSGIVHRSNNATCPAILVHKSEIKLIKVRSLQITGRSVDAQATTLRDRCRRSVILFRGL